MGKGGKYVAAGKKKAGKQFAFLAVAMILILTGILFFQRKDNKGEQKVPGPTVQTAEPDTAYGTLSADDVQWAQASIWKDSSVHLFLTKQQIADIIDAVNALDPSTFEKTPVNGTVSVLLTFSDQEIQLQFDGERVGFISGSENLSVSDPALMEILNPIARLDNTKQWISYMTAYDMKNLYLYKDNVTWEFFEDFAYYITGPDEMQIPVEESHFIHAVGNQNGRPVSLQLVENDNTDNYIDIRTSDINTLLACFQISEADSSLEVKPGDISEYNQEQARIDGCVVMQNGDVLDNQKNWQNFMELTEAGAEASVTVVHYTEEESDMTYIRYGLIFDGSIYTLKITAGEQQLTYTFTGLEMTAGEAKQSQEPYDYYIRYTLTGGTETADVVVVEDRISTPDLNNVSKIDFHMKQGEPPLKTYEDPAEIETILNLLKTAEYQMVPPDGYIFGVSLMLQKEDAQQMILEVDILQGIYRYADASGYHYYKYGELSDLFRVLGITQWPEQVKQEYGSYLN